MIQQCPACQVIIDRPAKFCRQCGTPLPVLPVKKRSPDWQGNSRRQERLGTAPSPTATVGRRPNPATTVPASPRLSTRSTRDGARLSNRRLFTLILLLLFLLGIGSYLIVNTILYSPSRAKQEPHQTSIEKRPTPERLSRPSHDEIEQRYLNALRSFGETRNSPPSQSLLDGLGKLVYPGARNSMAFELKGSVMLRSTTTDSIDEVINFYQSIFDSPPLEKVGTRREETVFSRFADVDTFVILARDYSRDGLLSIAIIRARPARSRVKQ